MSAIALPQPQLIEIAAGAHQIIVATLETAENISGWTFAFQIWDEHADDDDEPLAELTSAGGEISITDTDDGEIEIELEDEHTSDLSGNYRWNVWRTNSGAEQCLARGPFKAKARRKL